MKEKMETAEAEKEAERKARIEEAAKHPNAEDCKAAQDFIRGVLASLAN